MIGFDVGLNGQPLCLASVGEQGVLTALVTWVARSGQDPAEGPGDGLSLHVGGRAGRHTYNWDDPSRRLKVGDVVEIKIVEVDSADEAIKAASVEADPEGKPGWFDEARQRYRKSGA